MRLLFISGIFVSKICNADKTAFVLLGPTGDNAVRNNGIWQGLYEAFAAGTYDSSTVGIHPTMNTPHTVEELRDKFFNSVNPLYETLQNTPGWECKQEDCNPEAMWVDVEPNINIWDGRDADAQAEDMIPALEGYSVIDTYLSVPPSAFGGWATAAATYWGSDRVNVAAEKPFGTSTEDAANLYDSITELLPENHLLIVDHWLSFFMIKNLPTFRSVMESSLGVSWSDKSFSKIVVTEDETRGLEGRGKFFDGVGQVRDMIQSHLLQTLALSQIGPDQSPRSEAKLEIFDNLVVKSCTHGQYDGWLMEDGLSYHPEFADATLSTMNLQSSMSEWAKTEIIMTTGKLMGEMLYSVDMYEAGGPGKITIDIGAESVGVADIKVYNWPLADSSSFEVPKPGFDEDETVTMEPSVSSDGHGYILSYDTKGMYFPKPYAIMIGRMLEANYGSAFVTYPEVHQSWIVVTAGDSSLCLDPPPEKVLVYKSPDSCGNTPSEVCYTGKTVLDLYDVTFACTEENDVKYKDVDFYQAKCAGENIFNRRYLR